MKILIDQNISFRILSKLKSFPEAQHVDKIGLTDARDRSIWEYAIQNDFAILTFDKDFFQMASLMGVPPKIIWIRTGNLKTSEIVKLLEDNVILIKEFLTRDHYKDIACLELDW